MIVNRKDKFAIFLPFKNYSNSLIDFFVTSCRTLCYVRYIGDVPCYSWEKPLYSNAHTCVCPELIMGKEWKRYLPIRNPYDRVISQWKWHLQRGDDQPEFEDWLMLHSKQAVSMPVTKVYSNYTDIIKCENIKNEIFNNDLMPIGPDREKQILLFPHSNKSKIKKPPMQLTRRQQEIIYYFHYEDFLVGGYSKTYNPS